MNDDITEIKKFLYRGIEYNTVEEIKTVQANYAKRRQQIQLKYPMFCNYLDKQVLWSLEDEGTERRGYIFEYVFGTFNQVIDHCVGLDKFWGYGPGEIREVKFTDLNKKVVDTALIT